jgi:hypothetical protein
VAGSDCSPNECHDRIHEGDTRRPNKRMQLTKLRAAPEHGRLVWLSSACRLIPAKAGVDAGTASQLIRRVRRSPGTVRRHR